MPRGEIEIGKQFSLQSCWWVLTMAAAMNLVDAMKELYMKGEGTDVTLVCQGTRKAAHSSVLIARFSFERSW